jgi:O-antigen ligase
MRETVYPEDGAGVRGAAATAAGFLAFAFYVAVAAVATLIYPLFLTAFLAPAIFMVFAFAPQGRAVPKTFIMPLIFAAAALMPFWPTYIHVAIGSLPILTPPRVVFYMLTVIWIYDMTVSPLRRAQFLVAIKRRPWLAGLVFAFFVLNAMSVPLAEGKVMAAQAFFRQTIILLLPFCLFLTYVRRWREFRLILMWTAMGAAAAGAIAMGEAATKTLLAAKLSPLIMGDDKWLQIVQTVKSRDGVFRAQATHTHPISLGEFLCFCAPLAFALALRARRTARWLWFGALALVIGGVIATNSRGAMLALAPGIGVILFAVLARILRNPAQDALRPAIGLLSLVMIAASPVFVYTAHSLVTGDAGTSAARSSQSRIDQVKMAWPKIQKRPVLGYGTGRAARIVGYVGRNLTLDNYYLTLAVDVGLPGPVLFLLLMIVAARRSFQDAAQGPPDMRWLLIALAAAMAAFMVSRLVNSQTLNLNYFFPLVAAPALDA